MTTDNEQARRAEVWGDIRESLRAMLPGISDDDVVLITRLMVKQIWGDGPELSELRREHLATDRPHDETCAVCGFFDSARYHAKTGRYLTDEMARAEVKS
jgi:hypothetical protein